MRRRLSNIKFENDNILFIRDWQEELMVCFIILMEMMQCKFNIRRQLSEMRDNIFPEHIQYLILYANFIDKRTSQQVQTCQWKHLPYPKSLS
jgi:hypothetical protein